jgi:hypothetical protein
MRGATPDHEIGWNVEFLGVYAASLYGWSIGQGFIMFSKVVHGRFMDGFGGEKEIFRETSEGWKYH